LQSGRCHRLLYGNVLVLSTASSLMTILPVLTLILLTWTKWRAPTNASKWRMGFNSAFKGLISTHYKYVKLLHKIVFQAFKVREQLGDPFHLMWNSYYTNTCQITRFQQNQLLVRVFQNKEPIFRSKLCVMWINIFEA
jgi:hypothetical protein